MAAYCDKECEEIGGICDFCIHYRDENEGTDKGFAGEGMCLKKNEVVEAHFGCEDDFHCSLVGNQKEDV